MHQYPAKQILSEQLSNHAIDLTEPEFLALHPDFQIAKSVYYPYNHKYDDFAWGCAWRAIQTVLHSQFHNKEAQELQNIQKIIDFKMLVQKYRQKNILLPLMQKCTNISINEEVKQGRWAPEYNQNCWAEPLICKLICKDFKLETQLILVNGYPKAYAPQSVFSDTLTFSQFCTDFIMKYLPESPIMIDDGLFALSIIGYKRGVNEQVHLLMADPHISSNRAQQNSKLMKDIIQQQHKSQYNKYVGIYEVVLDKNGVQIGNSVGKMQELFYPMDSFNKVFFSEKKWMAVAVINK